MYTKFFSLALFGLAAAAPVLDLDLAAIGTDEEAMELVRRQYPVLPCSHLTGGIHVLALGGANTDNPKDYGYLGSLAQSILKAIPGSTNVSVPYDKRFQSLNPPTLMPNAIANGMKTLKAYTVQYHHACPNTKMALIGYSSGAVIMSNDMCYGGDGNGTPQLNPLLVNKYIIAAIAYGDETRVAGQSYNRGTCTSYSGSHARANPSLCAPYAPIIQSYCDNQDSDCCVGSGNSPTVHFSYPAKYDGVATQFVQSQLAKNGGA